MSLINCDLGECLIPDPDAVIMPLIDMANIACGGHAGDDQSMAKTITLAKQHNVKIGAHPSYSDRVNFGRISQRLTGEQLSDVVRQQLLGFIEQCQRLGVEMSYIKPHGALYHDMMQNPEVLAALIDVARVICPQPSLVVRAGTASSDFLASTVQLDVEFMYEAFADRRYSGNELVARHHQGALLIEPQQIVKQYHFFSKRAPFPVDTVCFHSDNPASVDALQIIKGH